MTFIHAVLNWQRMSLLRTVHGAAWKSFASTFYFVFHLTRAPPPSTSFHTFVTLKKSVWRRWTFCMLLLTLTSRPRYIFIDRLFVLNSTMTSYCCAQHRQLCANYCQSVTHSIMNMTSNSMHRNPSCWWSHRVAAIDRQLVKPLTVHFSLVVTK